MNIQRLEEFLKTDNGRLIIKEISEYINSIVQKDLDAFCVGMGFMTPYINGDDSIFKNTFSAVNKSFRTSPWPESGLSKSLVIENYLFPFRDNSIDLFLLVHELEYVSNPESLLREVRRTLKVNGKVVIITSHKFGKLPFIACDLFPWLRSWSRASLTKLLSKSGFYVNKTGKMALDSWVKIFGDIITVEAQKIEVSPVQLLRTPEENDLKSFEICKS